MKRMLFKRANNNRGALSADHIYLEARSRWAKVVSLSIYDNEDMLYSVVRLLEKARRQNGQHVQSLVLLSDLFMQLGADREAMPIVESLLTLQPQNQTHVQKKALLQQLQVNRTDRSLNAVREFIEARWTQTNDW
ncbi:MAG: hypothetical protein F6K11_13930 [Leptolyngbya sp. SIO3F4]|nr:hypothetical protein [Leptolyngbya sp. SIO3F4]